MKILQPVTTEQVLKIIPREYSTAVDLQLTNEESGVMTEFTNLPTSTVLGYLNIPSTFSSSVSNGVKLIALNNESLISPAGDYFGNTIDGLNIEVIFNETSGNISFLTQFVDFSNYIALFRFNDDIYFTTVVSGVTSLLKHTFITFPTDGKFTITGSGTTGFIYLDDVLLGSSEFISTLTTLQAAELNTGYNLFYGAYSDMIVNSIKINNHEWIASNWTAPTTTNNLGVVTTLNSDVSTSAMIQTNLTALLEDETYYSYKVLDYTTKDIIYKGKIFVTSQTISDYSINNGQYTERGKDNTYITY